MKIYYVNKILDYFIFLLNTVMHFEHKHLTICFYTFFLNIKGSMRASASQKPALRSYPSIVYTPFLDIMSRHIIRTYCSDNSPLHLCNYLKMTNSLDGQSPAPLSNRQRRANQHKEKAALLLEATERLIASGHSFTELSVEKLCQEAGIGRSTYYVYFQDKGDLIRKLSEKISAEMTQGSKSWLDVVSHATREQLKLAMIETLQTYRRHQAVFTALAETASYDPEVEAAFNELLTSYTRRALEAIHAGDTRGLIRQDVDEATFMGLVWMCERVAYRMVRNGDDAQLHKAADVITTIAWRTLYEDNPGADPSRR